MESTVNATIDNNTVGNSIPSVDLQPAQAIVLENIVPANNDNGLNDNIALPSFGVTWFSAINSNVTDVVFDSWQTMKKALHNVVKDDITHEEFAQMKKAKDMQVKARYTAIKGKNGVFISGVCYKEGNNYTCKQGAPPPTQFWCLAMDFDGNLPSNFEQLVCDALEGLEFTAYTTVTATLAEPRWRVVVPLQKPINATERNAVMRVVVNRIGFAGFDKTSLEGKRKQCLPVQLQGETVRFIDRTGTMLDAVQWLNEFWPNWHDPASLPKLPNELEDEHRAKTVKKFNLTPQEWVKKDKPGIIGAFCKAYSCADVLKRSGLYKLTRNGENESRWSRMGDTDGGIVVYNTDTCKCWYCNDILAGRSAMNAFQLMAVLFHGGDFKEAYAEAKIDEKVRAVLLKKLIDLKPKTAGEWGDSDAYSTGFRGVLERLIEFKHYKFVVTDEEKMNGYFVVFDGKRYTPISLEAIGDDIQLVCRITMAENPDIDLWEYVKTNTKAVSLAKSLKALGGISTKQTDWDNDPWKITAQDCVIDIRAYILKKAKEEGVTIHGWENLEATEPFLPHSPKFLTKKMLSVGKEDWTQEGDDYFHKYLNECMPDANTRNYMLAAIGSSLGDCSQDHKIVFLLGKAGRNGKSAFIGGLNETFGEYIGTANAKNFVMGKFEGDTPSPEMDSLRGKRVAIFSEAPSGTVLDVEKLKNWVGSPRVRTRGMHVGGGEWKNRARFLLDCNNLPRVSNCDNAFKARLRIIPWDVSFEGREDPLVAWNLETNKAVHAALLKALLEGCYVWAKNGFMLDRSINEAPAEVQHEVDLYYEDNDEIGRFITNCIEITEDFHDFECMQQLYDVYTQQGVVIKYNSFCRKLNQQLDVLAKSTHIKRGNGTLAMGDRLKGWFGLKLTVKTNSELADEYNEKQTYSYDKTTPQAVGSRRFQSVKQDAETVETMEALDAVAGNKENNDFDYCPF